MFTNYLEHVVTYLRVFVFIGKKEVKKEKDSKEKDKDKGKKDKKKDDKEDEDEKGDDKTEVNFYLDFHNN